MIPFNPPLKSLKHDQNEIDRFYLTQSLSMNLISTYPILSNDFYLHCPTVLHCACALPNLSEDDLEKLISYYPHALMTKDEVGETPLMRAILSGEAPDSTLRCLIHACPQAIGSQDHDGNTPLHLSFHCGVSDDIIHLMIWSYPSAITISNYYYNFPLHYACQYGASFEIITELCNNSSLITAVNAEQRSPIDYAWSEYLSQYSEAYQSIEVDSFFVVCFLLVTVSNVPNPYSVAKDLSKVLHFAIRLGGKCPFSLLKFLLEEFPYLAWQKDSYGRVPLHEFCNTCFTSKSDYCKRLEVIINAFPSAVFMRDGYSRAPIHYLLMNDQLDRTTRINSLECVLMNAPMSLGLVDRFTGLLPFMMASSSEHSDPCLEITFRLLLKDPSYLSMVPVDISGIV